MVSSEGAVMDAVWLLAPGVVVLALVVAVVDGVGRLRRRRRSGRGGGRGAA
ncbi:hypothetical protein [Streptomyces sp. TR06-5]|uniref:hypothetical protein n=1 Tax=unclassified Streptomyces TaxID=2593676 RepID=UPI0039A08B42